MELHRGGVVLHGCGDLVNDYEGIGGHEQFRGELRVLHVVTLDSATGHVQGLELIPFRSRRLRLERANAADTQWFARTLDASCRPLGTRVELAGNDRLRVAPR